jgi:hypothetical protein
MARSAKAVMLSDEFTPRLAGMAEPSNDVEPRIAEHLVRLVDHPLLGAGRDGGAAERGVGGVHAEAPRAVPEPDGRRIFAGVSKSTRVAAGSVAEGGPTSPVTA